VAPTEDPTAQPTADPTPQPTPAPTLCSPTMTGFVWSSFNGQWTPVDGVTAGGTTVYSKVQGTYTWYMWLETDYSSAAWVIGSDYAVNSYYGWKFGEDLFDGANWYYYSGGWNLHSANPTVSCSADPVVGASASAMSIYGAASDATMVSETQSHPPMPDEANSDSSVAEYGVFVEVAVGAMLGVVAIMICVALYMKRNKGGVKAGDDVVHHVPDRSPIDSVEVVTMEVSSGKEFCDGAGVTTADAGNTESV